MLPFILISVRDNSKVNTLEEANFDHLPLNGAEGIFLEHFS
jgi:hypothetical protein